MNLFYAPQCKNKQVFGLDENESRHCIAALRAGVGEILYVTDGRGMLCKARISGIGKKNVQVEIIERQEGYATLPYNLHIAIAPTKQMDRLEWFVEKATEIGITSITPLIAEHSERKQIRKDRLEKVAIAAMKQSLKTEKPAIHNLIHFNEFIDQKLSSKAFLAHCRYSISNLLLDGINKGDDITILIGPEGDFSKAEVAMALKNGIKEISLGNSRLRTETAGIVACHSVAVKNR